MADDLQITPQGDEPSTGDSSQAPGGYKFDPSQDTGTANGNINLAGGKTSAPIPGLIGASSEQEGEIIAPMKLDTEAPKAEEAATESAAEAPKAEEAATESAVEAPKAEEAVTETPGDPTAETSAEEAATVKPTEEKSAMMETSPETESTEDVSSEDASEEMPTEEGPADTETPAEQAPKKKGLSKAVLIGGALALAMLIGAGAYYGLGGLFKGELAVPSNLEEVQYPAAEELTNLCPIDHYYDAATMSTSTLEIRDNQLPDLTNTRTSLERNFAARDFGRAQFMPISDAIIPQLDQPVVTTTTTTTSDPILSTDMLDTNTTVTTTTVTNDADTLNLDAINTGTTSDLVINANTNDALIIDESIQDINITDQLNSGDMTTADAFSPTLTDSVTGDMTTTDSFSPTLTDSVTGDMTTTDSFSPTLTDSVTGDMTIAAPSTDAVTFDPAWCQPIPQTDCALLEKLRAEPSSYFIQETTIMHMDEWLLACNAVTTCGKNEVLIDGLCSCEKGTFDISSALITDNTNLVDAIAPQPDLTCVTCDQLDIIIQKKVEALASPLVDMDTVALEKEITQLKELAAVNCVQEEIIVVQECPPNQVRDVTGACVCDTGYTMNVDGICTLSTQPVITTCGTNQTLQRDGICACNAGYFDISSTEKASTDFVRITDVINTTSTLQCVNCDELYAIINRKSEELNSMLVTADKTALEAEITSLKAIAAENCPVEETVPIKDLATVEEIVPERDVITVVEKSACELLAENAEVLLARGDVSGSYDAVIEYIKNDCGRTYSDCEENLAIAKTAKEYSSIAATLSPASVSYFNDQYTRNRNAFYANPECVNTTDLCVEVQSEPVINDRILTDTVDEPSVELLATDRIDTSSDVLRVGTTADEPMTLDNLQRDVDYYISVKGIEDEAEKADYIIKYCPVVEETPPREVTTVVVEETVTEREVTTVVEEVPAPTREVTDVVEQPAPVRLVPITVPEETVTSPPSSGSRDSEPTAVLAAAEEQPIAGGSVSKPIAGGTVTPAAPATEEATVESDTYVASTTTTTTTTSTTETVTPETATPDLRPAATVATPEEPTLTPVDPATPAPLITEETAPPDIYPVGPEVYMYAFALIASQLFFFRRRILEFVMNK